MKELEDDQIETLYWEFKDRQTKGNYSERDLLKFAVQKAYVPLKADNIRLSAQVESMTCDDEAVKEMAEALEGLLYRTEGISLQDKWDAGLMALQKYKARINESCIHWEEKQ